MPVSPEEIANCETISGPYISWSGEHVVYSFGPSFCAKGANKTRSLWIADIDIANSARQITSGLFNDHSPKFHKSGDIFFLSDRHKPGAGSHIYRLSTKAFGGDPKPVTLVENTQGVQDFEISPDGRWIAYTSTDEPAEKDEEDKDTYVIIWRAPKRLARLRILDLSGQTEGSQTIVSLDSNVECFTWAPDSTQILYLLTERSDAESYSFPVSEHIISVAEGGGKLQFSSVHIATHARAPRSRSLWSSQDAFYYRNGDDLMSAPSLWKCNTAPGSSPTRVAFGDTDDAAGMPVSHSTVVAIEVARGLDAYIEILDPTGKFFTAFETSNDCFSGWDLRTIEGKYLFVVVRSSSVSGEPDNLWCGWTEAGVKGVLQTQLSSHHEWMKTSEMPQCAPFYWTDSDGMELQGVIAHARGQELEKLPTVVVPHGGPYSRDLVYLSFPAANYRNFLASHGFLVLSPNYRGSQGRGDAFARAAGGGMGKADYADIESMLAEAIKRGYADPQRVAIAGYSQGGFLAAWGVTRPNAPWKTAVIGAAPTDWGSLTVCSDLPDMEAALGGAAPWSPGPPVYLDGSPIRDVRNVSVPVLLVHGEKDERVPLSQAIGFMRGLVRGAPKNVSSASTLIIYPREGHIFREKAHMVDYLTRVLAHLKTYLPAVSVSSF